MRRAPEPVSRVLQRGYAVFFALALEPFLSCFELRDAPCYFFSLESEPAFVFGHPHPF
jgi:hypothetical protein